MPQFDLSKYTSQIFWLIVLCSFLILFLKYILVPNIELIFKKRRDLLEEEEKKIAALRKHLQEVQDIRSEQIKTTEQEVHSLIHKAYQNLEMEKEQSLQSLERELQEQIKTFEQDLQKELLVAKEMYAQNLESYLKTVKENLT